MLSGGAGRDIIAAGTGRDRANGGAGKDLFVLEQGSGWVTIEDYTLGSDRLGLVGINAADVTFEFDGTNTSIFAGEDLLAFVEGVSLGASEIQSTVSYFTAEDQLSASITVDGCTTTVTAPGTAV